VKYRTEWYRDQQRARQELVAAKSAARRRRPRPRIIQTWSHLEDASVTLAALLEDVLATMRSHPTPGQPAPEITVSLVTDLTDDPPTAVEAPVRAKPVNLAGRRRIVAGGKIETYAVLGKIEITARLVIYGPAGEAPPPEMSRRTWYLPVKTAEKRGKSPANGEDEK
jgi:hypothetical protein